jgi:hypothetical protein
MTIRFRIVLLVVLASLVAPRTYAGDRAGDSSRAWINIERTACYGTCPQFTLRIAADGGVVYDGKRFVMRRGVAERRLRPAEVDKLRRAVDQSGFAKLETHCCDCVTKTDAPSTLLDIADQNGLRSIRHYHGCASVPKSLSVLEESIISLSGAGKWIGSEAERERQKWSRNSP